MKPALGEGIAASGRKPDEVELVQSVITSVAPTTEEAFAGARMQIAFYGTTRTYRPVFEIHGWGDVVEPLRAAHAGGDIAGMMACVTDEMVETFAVAGTPDEARDKMRRYHDLVDTIVLNPPWASAAIAERTPEAFERLLETFAPG